MFLFFTINNKNANDTNFKYFKDIIFFTSKLFQDFLFMSNHLTLYFSFCAIFFYSFQVQAALITPNIYCWYGSVPLEPHELKERYLRHLATKIVLTIYCWCGGAC